MSDTGILQVSEQSSRNGVCGWGKEELGFDLLALNPMSHGHVCCAVTNTHSLMLRMASYLSCILCVLNLTFVQQMFIDVNSIPCIMTNFSFQ